MICKMYVREYVHFFNKINVKIKNILKLTIILLFNIEIFSKLINKHLFLNK